jgi:hypothetical protein
MQGQALLKAICRDVLKIDDGIRFVGIADEKGKIIVQEFRAGVVPHLSGEESEMSILQAVIRKGMRNTFESKIGKQIYSSTMYEKVKRANIPLRDGMTLLVSFEVKVDHESLILKKIIPTITRQASLAA